MNDPYRCILDVISTTLPLHYTKKFSMIQHQPQSHVLYRSHLRLQILNVYLPLLTYPQLFAKKFYEYIDAADILEDLRRFLTHEDSNLRAKTCSAFGNMCRHSSYFNNLLAKHHIISLLIDRCADPDKRTRKFACFVVGNAAYHNDWLYDELRRAIPQLTNLLLAGEEDKTKANAAGALSNLVHNSNRLCEDIVSKGAVQALLRVVADCSTVVLNPRRDATNESPLKIVLFSLVKMSAYPLCRQFIRSSELFPFIGQLRQSPESNIANYASFITSKVES